VKKLARLILALCMLPTIALLSACATRISTAPTLYDFGPLPSSGGAALGGTDADGKSVATARRLPPISVAEVNAPAWLDGSLMFYRLGYTNVQQPHPYAHSRWNSTPAQLLEQRLKRRIVQAGGTALSATDGIANAPLLRIDADEFIQFFDSAGQSSAQVTLRASVFNGRALLGQKLFTQKVGASSADAAGGAKALASASDAAIGEIVGWLADLFSAR
jgi:cholesterol transport system auxiliary component